MFFAYFYHLPHMFLYTVRSHKAIINPLEKGALNSYHLHWNTFIMDYFPKLNHIFSCCSKTFWIVLSKGVRFFSLSFCLKYFFSFFFFKYIFIIQGCESSSFQLISSVLKIFLCQNFSFIFYFQPIFGILPWFHGVFLTFACGLSHLWLLLLLNKMIRYFHLLMSVELCTFSATILLKFFFFF